jgi:large subunit ribosomal protein L29
MTSEELAQASQNGVEDLFRLRFQHHTGQLMNTAQLGQTRRSIARVKTMQSQRAKEAVGDSNE